MIEKAITLLRSKNVIGLPTETVYGLGGDATCDEAVALIYQLKGRPSFNPLIIHVASERQAAKYAFFNEEAKLLANAFWPGPLTLVLPLISDELSDIVTAGLNTVAVRCPSHPVALELLSSYPNPIAAPSANKSGYISPTTSAHVRDCFGDGVFILEGGDSPVGVESTIVDCSLENIRLLRPGFVTKKDIESVLGVEISVGAASEAINAPGQLKSHYAPSIPLRMNVTSVFPGEALLSFGQCSLSAKHELNLSPDGCVVEAASNLFKYMRVLDALADNIAGIAVSPIPEVGIGAAINERLSRAAFQEDLV